MSLRGDSSAVSVLQKSFEYHRCLAVLALQLSIPGPEIAKRFHKPWHVLCETAALRPEGTVKILLHETTPEKYQPEGARQLPFT